MQPVISKRRLPDACPDPDRDLPATSVLVLRNAKCIVALITWFLIGLLISLSLGCAPMRSRIVHATSIATEGLLNVEMVRREPQFSKLKRLITTIPRPSEETEFLLRKYNLTQPYEQDPDLVIEWFEGRTQSLATIEEVHGLGWKSQTRNTPLSDRVGSRVQLPV
jgi:hypothetical protein